jgi:uncharacterized protein YndB with AHSA1/START domain
MAGPNGERMENKGIWLEIDPLCRLVFTDAFTEGFVPAAEPFMTGVVERPGRTARQDAVYLERAPRQRGSGCQTSPHGMGSGLERCR